MRVGLRREDAYEFTEKRSRRARRSSESYAQRATRLIRRARPCILEYRRDEHGFSMRFDMSVFPDWLIGLVYSGSTWFAIENTEEFRRLWDDVNGWPISEGTGRELALQLAPRAYAATTRRTGSRLR